MANVTLKNVKKIYDNSVTAVSDFCLDIKDKEFVVFVGPSGCGKTTTLRMVAGLEDITEGDLYIDDKRMNNIAPKDRDIAMVFQNYALYPHMTVYENMAFALKLRKIPKSEINLKVHKAAEILGIEDLLNRKPKALSGGQRQRVAIGRAIVREPKVFLMDEPLSNLDAKLRGQMRTELIKLRGKINATFVYVTHDQTEAMTLGDRIVIMKDGFIQQIGTPQSLFDEPANLFVAGFIGTPQMNFLPATLNVTNGHYYTTVFGRDLSLSSKMQEKLTRNKQEACNVFVGIRPEHLSIASEGADRSLKAKIDVSEMMGSEVYLHTNIEETDIVLRVPTQDMAGLPLNPGKDNYISFVLPENFMHLFNAESGNSLFADNIS